MPEGRLSRPPAAATLLATLVAVAVLGAIGFGVEDHLRPTSLEIGGTSSARGQDLARERFGDSSPLAVLLRGPAPALERQGPRLAAALRRDPTVTVISPWDPAPAARKLPAPPRRAPPAARSHALLLLDFHVPLEEAIRDKVPALERTIERRVHPPVEATQSGYATISRALQRESLAAAERAELIAAPLLLVVLLLVFRSVLAAAVPLLLGGLTVLAGRGVLVFLADLMPIDALSLVVCTMMGLALGVDYSLLIVSRFREELHRLENSAGESLSPRSSRVADAEAPTTPQGSPRMPGRGSEAGRSPDVFSPAERERRTCGHDSDPTLAGEDTGPRSVRSRQALSAIAARRTRESAGRTVVIAGATLFTSIFLSAFLQPGALLVSLATALVVVTGIAVLFAWLALPALLSLLGPAINAGQIGRARPGSGSRAAAAASAALRSPALTASAIVVPLLLLATPALAFNTGSPGVDELSASSAARRDAEEISRVAGPGWLAPFLLTVAADRGPMTAPARLSLLTSTQRRIETMPDADRVIGPAAIAAAARPLRSLGGELGPGRSSPASQLTRLGPRLRDASAGVSRLRGGLAQASAAGGLLGEGSARAGEGASLIAGGLDRARTSGERASAALERLAAGSQRLAQGQRVASGTAYGLSRGLGTVLPNLTAQGLGRARRLSGSLQSAASSDPSLAVAAHEAEVLASVLASNREELVRLRTQARDLNAGLGRLNAGGRRLSDGSARLATEAQGLSGGLGGLGGGAEALAGGLGELGGGAEALAGGLAEGFRRSYPLERGLRRAGVRVSRTAAPLGRRLQRLHRVSPRLFDSGYLAVAAIDGADPVRRSLAGEVLNVPRGGTAARYLVIPADAFNTEGSRRLGSRLDSLVPAIERRPALEAGVSGGAAVLNDYGSATKSRLPLVVGTIVLITFLMLVVLLRAPLLAALAVALNLLSVVAAIGVVSLACEIPARYPLGGHPYIDTVGAAAIFGVTFGLSIDYAVFLLARMKERRDALLQEPFGDRAGGRETELGKDAGSEGRGVHEEVHDRTRATEDTAQRSVSRHKASIDYGINKTASVITGAAAIMTAVFISFAAAPVATVSQMGLGLTVAIILDATVVRIVLLPALMLLIGDRVWHSPAWLERLLPSGAGGRAPAATRAEVPR